MQDELKERLEKLPKDIYKKEMDILNTSDGLESIGLQLKLNYRNIYAEVEAATGADKKKIYSNEEKRKAETDRRLGETNKEILDKQKEQENKKAIGNIELSYMKRQFSAAKAIARLG